MGGKMMRWLLSSIGYLLYTLVVLICLLWLLFPTDTVTSWLEQQLNTRYPHYIWKIESLRPMLPGRMELTGIAITPYREKKPMVIVDRLDLIPDPVRLVQKDKLIRYRLYLLGGTADGRIVSSTGFRQFECQGKVKGLQLEQLKTVQQWLQRKLNGTAAGDFSGQGTWERSGKMDLKGNLTITKGTLQLKKPVLGLEQLPYTKIESNFKYRNGQWVFEQGKLISTKMTATFSGRVETGEDLAAASLQLTGSIIPRPELFAGAGEKQLAQVVHTFLQDGGLPFTVSGTANEPGIHFEGGLSQALKRLQESKR
jgi:type II secretion system protein N